MSPFSDPRIGTRKLGVDGLDALVTIDDRGLMWSFMQTGKRTIRLTATLEGDRVVFSGGRYGSHSLDAKLSSADRVNRALARLRPGDRRRAQRLPEAPDAVGGAVVTAKIVVRVTNDVGRSFNVVLVCRGDRYGLADKLTHDKDDPLVEFWDATYESDVRFTPGRGQFAGRYYLSTLAERRGQRAGLDLCGEPAWKVTAKNVDAVLEAVESWQRTERKVDQRKDQTREDRERQMFGCTAAQIDEALDGKSPRDIAMYAMGTLSNAQELIRREEIDYDEPAARAGTVMWMVANRHDADTIRRLINVAKYAIDKAVPR